MTCPQSENQKKYERNRLMNNVHCTMYNLQCTMYNVHCTMYNVQFLYTVQYTLYTVQCTVLTALLVLTYGSVSCPPSPLSPSSWRPTLQSYSGAMFQLAAQPGKHFPLDTEFTVTALCFALIVWFAKHALKFLFTSSF